MDFDKLCIAGQEVIADLLGKKRIFFILIMPSNNKYNCAPACNSSRFDDTLNMFCKVGMLTSPQHCLFFLSPTAAAAGAAASALLSEKNHSLAREEHACMCVCVTGV